MLPREKRVIKDRKGVIILYGADTVTLCSEVHTFIQDHSPIRSHVFAFPLRGKIRPCGSVSDSHPTLLKNTEYLSNVSIWQCTLVGGWVVGLDSEQNCWHQLCDEFELHSCDLVWPLPPRQFPRNPLSILLIRERKKNNNTHLNRQTLPSAHAEERNRAAIFVLLELQTFPSECGWSWVSGDVERKAAYPAART